MVRDVVTKLLHVLCTCIIVTSPSIESCFVYFCDSAVSLTVLVHVRSILSISHIYLLLLENRDYA